MNGYEIPHPKGKHEWVYDEVDDVERCRICEAEWNGRID